MKKKRNLSTPEICPVCGEGVPPRALACPECGADDNSGWREGAESYDGVDLPDQEFNYDKFVRQEFDSGVKPAGIKTVWWITALLLVLVSLAIYLLAAR